MRKLNILPNAYYNFLKNRKAEYHRHKEEIKCEISDIYHSHNGTDGYRTVHVYLLRRGYKISRLTVHKYMNTELQLFSIARRRKPDYEYGTPHKVFENKLQQDFKADTINQKWCTDFTYLFLTDGSKRYNCTIIDLHERIVIASITDKHITADLAKRTLQKAISSQPGLDTSQLILHSDQGSQYTSKEFTEYCETVGITQSMSKAGCPYDNALWSVIIIPSRMNLLITIIIILRKSYMKLSKNSRMFITIMNDRILIIITKLLLRHVMSRKPCKQKIRSGCYKKA